MDFHYHFAGSFVGWLENWISSRHTRRTVIDEEVAASLCMHVEEEKKKLNWPDK